MPAPYSRSISFSTESGDPVGIRVPVPFRGTLTRLVLQRTSSTGVAASFKLYDRRGACANLVDLNVANSGTVTSVGNSSGQASVTFGSAHGLWSGDRFEIKGSSVAAYNRLHVVQTVGSPTVVVTDVAYTSAGSGGLWQTEPAVPTVHPAMHLILSDSIASDATVKDLLNLNVEYENRDNYNPVTRLASDSLWLEFDPGAADAATWELAFTVHPASFVV